MQGFGFRDGIMGVWVVLMWSRLKVELTRRLDSSIRVITTVSHQPPLPIVARVNLTSFNGI